MLSIFGIRHHGPGSTRSLLTALEDLRPDLILVEGPPDANALIPDVGRDGMIPPVALLLYDPEAPARAVYYPFAEFSPEWQALCFALGAGIPVRFMDLAQAHRLGQADEPAALPADQPDPFALAARAAGYSDIERWWERFVEQRRGVPGKTFQAVLTLMTALREESENADSLTLRREAAMRQIIRQAQEEGAGDVAVVCGAWHAPALANPEAFTEDANLLAGLPESGIAATWVPWTYDRLSRRSGYGAGIDSPGWYDHLWHTRAQVAEGWMVRAARLMREADLGVSPAHAIEAARLAEALAALRGHPLPGLPEMREAIRAVFCFDTDAPMRLIQEKLIISQRMGEVSPETPEVPLARDLAAIQRRTRFKPSAESKIIDLDLRRPLLLERSQLLHRLNLLGIPWGRLRPAPGGKGTFHEIWKVEWLPEFAVRVIEASLWGNTVAGAAASRARALAEAAQDLPALTGLVEAALMADLGEVIPFLMARLQRMAAASSDINHLMRALPPLAGVLRYGDVRKTETALVEPVVQEMVTRICIGLPPACLSLDDDAARGMVDQIGAVDETLDILRGLVAKEEWTAALEDLAGEDRVHGLVRGCACQRLFGDPAWEAPVSVWMNRALSPGTPPEHAAAWLEGFLTGNGQLLIYHPHLWEILDDWVGGIPEAAFTRLLPLLRRTFSTFSAAERRKLGERARTGRTARAAGPGGELDAARAEAALSLVMAILKDEESS